MSPPTAKRGDKAKRSEIHRKRGGQSETPLNTWIAHSNSAYLLLSNNASDWLSGNFDTKSQSKRR